MVSCDLLCMMPLGLLSQEGICGCGFLYSMMMVVEGQKEGVRGWGCKESSEEQVARGGGCVQG